MSNETTNLETLTKHPLTSIQPKTLTTTNKFLQQPKQFKATKCLKENLADANNVAVSLSSKKLKTNVKNAITPQNLNRNAKSIVTPKNLVKTSLFGSSHKKVEAFKSSNVKTPNSTIKTATPTTATTATTSFGIYKNQFVFTKTPLRSTEKNVFSSGTTKLTSATKSSKTEENTFNFIYNGKDYTDICMRKAEYGYSGAGYIVEFECDAKYLKGLIVDKGLWRVNSEPNYKPRESILDFGPIRNLTQIDVPEKKTPRKLHNFDDNFSRSVACNNATSLFNKANASQESVGKKIVSEMRTNLKSKQALGVRFAEIVQKIDPSPPHLNNSISSPQIDRIGMGLTANDYYDSNQFYNEYNYAPSEIGNTSKPKHLTPGHKGMRRSMSVNDISKLKLTISLLEDDEGDEHTSMVMMTMTTTMSSHDDDENTAEGSEGLAINVTYDKSLNSSSTERLIIPQQLNPTSSSPIPIRPVPPLQQTDSVDLSDLNRQIQELVAKFLASAPLEKRVKLNEEIEGSRQDKLNWFSALNANTKQNENGMMSTSTSDSLDFLEISQSLKKCLDFYEKNLILKKSF